MGYEILDMKFYILIYSPEILTFYCYYSLEWYFVFFFYSFLKSNDTYHVDTYLFEIPSLQIDTCVAYIMYKHESLEIFIFFIHMIYINYAYMRYKNNIIYSVLYIYILP